MEEMQRNVWIYMYVLFCTLFVLGLEWSRYLFLVSYIVLIPFQCVINDYQWSISKMSTYIRIFFEKKDFYMAKAPENAGLRHFREICGV